MDDKQSLSTMRQPIGFVINLVLAMQLNLVYGCDSPELNTKSITFSCPVGLVVKDIASGPVGHGFDPQAG